MRRARRIAAVLAVAACIAVLVTLLRPAKRFVPEASFSVADALGGGSTGFLRVEAPRTFRFPEDHGPHPGYRTEWWYWTGNLDARDGRRFGYQLTFFRSALAARPAARDAGFAASEVYMAHFTVTDVAGKRFTADGRFSRAALALAGATASPFAVWVEGWRAEGGNEGFPVTLTARSDGAGLRLVLGDGPVVLQGQAADGLSRKSAETGNASYYYSMPRLPTTGTLELPGEAPIEVRGESWMDREWGTSQLAAGQVGWDWFALQLSNGESVMLYRLRRADGSADPFSAGSFASGAGSAEPLTAADFRLGSTGQWKSPHSGVVYPSGWTVEVATPRRKASLRIAPLLEDQELNLAVRYWEGAVRVEGEVNGVPVSGRGYVELTGYGEEPHP